MAREMKDSGIQWVGIIPADWECRRLQKIVLPLLHNISLDMLKEKYPFLGDIQTIDSGRYSKEEITILFAKEPIKRLR